MDSTHELYSCQRCGYCCHGETTVSLNRDDLARLLHILDIDEQEAFEKYLRKTKNVVQMKIVDGHCIFYNNGCLIHSGRPWRCAQWPLHPSIILDKSNFETIHASCPGINSMLGYATFCQKLKDILVSKDKTNA